MLVGSFTDAPGRRDSSLLKQQRKENKLTGEIRGLKFRTDVLNSTNTNMPECGQIKKFSTSAYDLSSYKLPQIFLIYSLAFHHHNLFFKLTSPLHKIFPNLFSLLNFEASRFGFPIPFPLNYSFVQRASA